EGDGVRQRERPGGTPAVGDLRRGLARRRRRGHRFDRGDVGPRLFHTGVGCPGRLLPRYNRRWQNSAVEGGAVAIRRSTPGHSARRGPGQEQPPNGDRPVRHGPPPARSGTADRSDDRLPTVSAKPIGGFTPNTPNDPVSAL